MFSFPCVGVSLVVSQLKTYVSSRLDGYFLVGVFFYLRQSPKSSSIRISFYCFLIPINYYQAISFFFTKKRVLSYISIDRAYSTPLST